MTINPKMAAKESTTTIYFQLALKEEEEESLFNEGSTQ